MDPNSATAQFFINVVDNPGLDNGNTRDGHGYDVFGKVVEGMDVVDKIREVPVRPVGGHGHVPTMPVTIIKATVQEK
jgi:peptidyl-prolyl cis-trans isomerase A (cyclophilin A)